MKSERVLEILDKIKNVTVAVCGDFCIDAYWLLDPRGSEISVETGLRASAVNKHYYSLGGASNIVANLAALKPKSIVSIGVIGDDVFGRELIRQFKDLHVDTSDMVIQKENFDTVAFGKQYLENNELPRIDFGFFNSRSEKTDSIIIEHLQKALKTVDVVILNQQVPGSLNDKFVCKVNTLLDQFADKIVLLDTRQYGDKFNNVYRKTNAVEAAQLNGVNANHGDVIAIEHTKKHARELYKKSGKAVFITRGARGIIIADSSGVHEIPGIQLMKKLDTVGCGDTTLSMLSLCMAAGITPVESAMMANFAAAVTAQKLFQTGTANRDEILAVAHDPDYIYQPELADDSRKAHYVSGTDIELCYPVESVALKQIKHAVFDHDGTISTLRQGWEEIMEPMMIQTILGQRYKTADETLYHRVRHRVREYIDKSTGIETVRQMQGLVEMVQEFGIVPPEQMLDKWGYKKIYNDALMLMVNDRTARFERGELNLQDFTVKGSVEFLKMLRGKGITLYLASGTDYEDVLNEARVLGYADLFNGGIYGSVKEDPKFSKKMVIERIMRENNLNGSELLVAGDGPVEMRESRKRDGLALGIASDEVRRYGINYDKRTRLIKAGAHFLVPDFSQMKALESLLFGS
ncbi:MAG: PfkB family carbohydrate kinase [Sedimentisphaerales bacterium]